jgi:hypothetical protein
MAMETGSQLATARDVACTVMGGEYVVKLSYQYLEKERREEKNEKNKERGGGKDETRRGGAVIKREEMGKLFR